MAAERVRQEASLASRREAYREKLARDKARREELAAAAAAAAATIASRRAADAAAPPETAPAERSRTVRLHCILERVHTGGRRGPTCVLRSQRVDGVAVTRLHRAIVHGRTHSGAPPSGDAGGYARRGCRCSNLMCERRALAGGAAGLASLPEQLSKLALQQHRLRRSAWAAGRPGPWAAATLSRQHSARSLPRSSRLQRGQHRMCSRPRK